MRDVGPQEIEYRRRMEIEIAGLLRFEPALLCAADAMAEPVAVSIGGHAGTLILPALPDWKADAEDPLHKPLVGPPPATTWKRGDEPLYWGRPVSYPSGDSSVAQAIVRFSIPENQFDVAVQEIYEAIDKWVDVFRGYVTLFTRQGSHRLIEGASSSDLDLLRLDGPSLVHIDRASHPTITITLLEEDVALHLDSLRRACQLASDGLPPRLEYRLLLAAYDARGVGDYRKAILEAAAAFEIALTNRILDEFQRQGIAYGEKLLSNFTALGGRIRLAKIVGIELPTDVQAVVVEPRNRVVHKGHHPVAADANSAISSIERMLMGLAPVVHE